MKVSPDTIHSPYAVEAVYERSVVIGGREYTRPLIISADRLRDDWDPPAVDQLRLEDFGDIDRLRPEILLLGTGARQHFPPPSLMAAFAQAGIGLEVMDTAAACRTFNILLAEYRRAAAALIMPRPGRAEGDQ